MLGPTSHQLDATKMSKKLKEREKTKKWPKKVAFFQKAPRIFFQNQFLNVHIKPDVWRIKTYQDKCTHLNCNNARRSTLGQAGRRPAMSDLAMMMMMCGSALVRGLWRTENQRTGELAQIAQPAGSLHSASQNPLR